MSTETQSVIDRLRDHLTVKWMAPNSTITGAECQFITLATLTDAIAALAERDAAKRAIAMALYGVDHDYPDGSLADLAGALHSVASGAIARAERAEALLSTAEKALTRTRESIMPLELTPRVMAILREIDAALSAIRARGE